MTTEERLPDGWAWTTLGELGEYINGRGFAKSEWSTRGRPIIRIQDLTGTGDAPNYFEGQAEDKYLVGPGDLLVSWAATLGAYIWRGPEGWLNQHIFKVQSYIDKLFHYYLIQATLQDLYRQTHGSGMVHITRGKFDVTPVRLPPLAEQHRIVAAIEEHFTRLDAGVASLRRMQVALKRYRAAVLKAAVEGNLTEGWRTGHPDVEPASRLLERILTERRAQWEANLRAKGKDPAKAKYEEPNGPDTAGLPALPEEWCWATVEQLAAPEANAIIDGPFGSNLKTEHYRSEGMRVIRLQNIGDGVFNDVEAFISPEHFATLSKHQVFEGDLVIAALGEKPPRSCLIPPTVGPAIVKADCIRFHVSQHAVRHYVHWALNADPTRERTSSLLHGVGRPRLNLGEIKSIVIPLPPVDEQQQIAAEVEQRLSVVDTLDAAVAVNLKRAERLRQSILERAFSGQLVPQDPEDEPASALLERIRRERSVQDAPRRANGTTTQARSLQPLSRASQGTLWQNPNGSDFDA